MEKGFKKINISPPNEPLSYEKEIQKQREDYERNQIERTEKQFEKRAKSSQMNYRMKDSQ